MDTPKHDEYEDLTADEIWEKYIKGTELECVLTQLTQPPKE